VDEFSVLPEDKGRHDDEFSARENASACLKMQVETLMHFQLVKMHQHQILLEAPARHFASSTQASSIFGSEYTISLHSIGKKCIFTNRSESTKQWM
jgi:hypothetical protein